MDDMKAVTFSFSYYEAKADQQIVGILITVVIEQR
jgi:hypothetical protein